MGGIRPEELLHVYEVLPGRIAHVSDIGRARPHTNPSCHPQESDHEFSGAWSSTLGPLVEMWSEYVMCPSVTPHGDSLSTAMCGHVRTGSCMSRLF